MAKKRINKEDVAPKGLFDNVIQGAGEAKSKIDFLTQSMKVLEETAKKVKTSAGGTSLTDTKGLKDFDALTRTANETAKAKLNIDKQLLQEKAKISQATRDQNKQIKTEIEATQKLTGEQKKSLGTLQKLELSNRKLRAERAQLNLETKKGQSRLIEINSALDLNNAKIKASGDAMKRQKMNVGNYQSALGGLRSALAQLGIAFGVFSLIKDVFSTVKDFEQSTANLASVLGETKDASGQWSAEMTTLINQSKDLGATTKFTAGEVGQLQLEYAKLGFSVDSITAMTEATLNLAGATGTDLADASQVVGGNLNAFGLGAEQAQRVVDVMAKSFNSSSLDMEKFKTSMAAVAPVAKAMGLNIEQTTALVGTLTDNNVDASTAGTGLRNMMLDAKKAGLTLDEALAKIAGSSDKVGTAFDLFGKRGATMGVILAENTEKTAELESNLFQAGGSAEKMADTQLDTLNGALALLRSAWEAVILKFEEGTGVFGFLKDVIFFVAENLETLLKVMASIGTAFGVYKLINLTTKSFKALTLAMNVNPFVLVASVIAGLVVALQAFNSEMTQAEKIQKTINDVMNEAEKAVAGEKAELSSLLLVAQDRNRTDEERIKAIEKLNELSPEYLGNLTLENVTTEEGVTAINAYIKALDRKALAQAIAGKKQELFTALIDAENSKLVDNIGFMDQLGVAFSTIGTLDVGTITKELSKTGVSNKKKAIADIKAEIEALDDLIKTKIENNELDLGDLFGDETDDGSGDGDKQKKLKDLREKIRDEQIKQIKDDEKRQIASLEEKHKREVKAVEDTYALESQKTELIKELNTNFNNDLKKIDKDFRKKEREARNEATQDLQKVLITEQKMKIQALEDGSKEQLKAQEDLDILLVEQIEQNNEILLQNTKLSEEEKKLIIIEGEKAIDEIYFASAMRREKFIEQQLKIVNDQYDRAEKEKLLTLLVSNKTQTEIEKEMTAFQIEELEKRIAYMKENYPKMTDQILDLEIELAEKKRKIWEDEKKELTDAEKENIELAITATKFATDLFVKAIDERIEKINEEIEAHKKRASELEELAKNGNITAKESLAEENRLLAEAEQERAEQEKRKQRILLISSFIQSYNSNLLNGDESGEALTKALVSQAFLDQIVSNLGSFFVGTEDTGTTSNPLDSNGGRLAVIHNNERIMTAKQNAMIGNYSNEEVAKVMEQKRLGRLMDNQQISIGYENILLVDQLSAVGDKLDKVNKTIENKPETNIRLGEITSKTMEIIETRKKGGTKTVGTFKVTPQ